MMRRFTILLLALALGSGAAWAGDGVLKRAQAKIKAKAQFSKAVADEVNQNAASQPSDAAYSGPRVYKTAAGITSQIDNGPNNTLPWGIYGPGDNIVRDVNKNIVTTAWARTPASGVKPRTIHAANSSDLQTWGLVGPLDQQVNSRGYYSDIFRAGSAEADTTEWIVWSERDQDRLDITRDLVSGLLVFDAYGSVITANNIPAPDAALDMVFTFATAGKGAGGNWNIYVSEFQTGGALTTTRDNAFFVKSTDNGKTWGAPKYVFGNGANQLPQRFSERQGGAAGSNYNGLAMAVDPNNANHIGALFISNWIEGYNAASNDSLLRPGGLGNVDYHYYFTQSADAGETWSTPEMLLSRNAADRLKWQYTVTIDTTGDGVADVSNPAYPYGGAQFWAFIYEPVFTKDGSFHAAIMPTLIEVPTGNLAIGIADNYWTAIYARRNPAGKWDYVHDLAGTVMAFDSTGNNIDPRLGQAWFAEMSVSADGNKLGLSWSSRLQAYNPPTTNSFPLKGALVVSGSPDGGNSWTDAVAFFPEPLPAATAANGGWAGSSVSDIIVQDASNANIYNFEFAFQGLGADNVTVHPALIGIWYTNEPSVDMSKATRRIGTAVGSNPTAVPKDFSLGQNYPNPFNPSTSIEYSIPIAGKVKLAIYNSIGQVIATLVDGRVAAGVHTATWDAQNVPTGIYFYKLEAEGFSQTKKMILAK